MVFLTPEAQEAFERIDTIHWTFHVALLSMSRYRAILSDKEVFPKIFPNTQFENPKITHEIENVGVLFTTSKKVILEIRNYDLYKAWQIALAITGMTSILEHYLKTIADKISGQSCQAAGIFYRFEETGIKPANFKYYTKLRHYYEVRNITMHNLARINPKFKKKTGEHHHKEDSYLFYPQQVTEYRGLIGQFLSFVEIQIK